MSCFGKDILQHFISKSQCTEKSSQHSRNVRTIPLIGCICLLLPGDIQLNPGLKCIGCVNYSPLPQDKSVKPELEWICTLIHFV